MSNKPPSQADAALHPLRKANPDARCPRAGGRNGKDVDEILQAAWDAGFWIEKRTHVYRCLHPVKGREPSDSFGVPTTPGRGRSMANTYAAARKAGVDV